MFWGMKFQRNFGKCVNCQGKFFFFCNGGGGQLGCKSRGSWLGLYARAGYFPVPTADCNLMNVRLRSRGLTGARLQILLFKINQKKKKNEEDGQIGGKRASKPGNPCVG